MRRGPMKSYIKYSFVVTLLFTMGTVAAGTVTAGEKPIWHNFVNEKTISGTLPSEAHVANTAPIWQTQVDSFHKANPPKRSDRQVSVESLAGTKPIWCVQLKCL